MYGLISLCAARTEDRVRGGEFTGSAIVAVLVVVVKEGLIDDEAWD